MNDVPWFKYVRVGDILYPIPLWNHTERGPNTLPYGCRVLAITKEPSQSGVLFSVRTKCGSVRTLDAGWFIPQKESK
jgi:hypothetical protein